MIGAWALLLLVSAPLVPGAADALRAGGFSSPQLEAAQARAVLEAELGQSPSAMVVVIQSTTEARAGQPAFEAAAAAAVANVATAEHVTGVFSHQLAPRQISSDGRTVYEVVGLDLAPDDSPQALEPVQKALREVPGVRTYLAGAPAFYGDIQAVSEADLQRSEVISLPLAALALLVVFGGVVAAGVPLVVGGASVVVALAAVFLVASVTPMSIFVLNLATLLGLGLGVDYSLLMTSRFREELARAGKRRQGERRGEAGRTDVSIGRAEVSIQRAEVEEAVALTVSTAGRAVFFSGLTVLLGVLGLVLFEFMILRSVGIAGAIVVGLAVLSALTLLPAVLALLGPRLERLSVRRQRPIADDEGRWSRLAHWVMDRPLQVFLPTLALLLLFGAPFLHVRFNAPDASILPPDVPSRTAFDLLVSEFGPGEFAPLSLAIRTDGPATSPENVQRLYDYSRRLETDPRVSRVDSIVDIDPRISLSQYQLLLSQPGGVPDRFIAAVLGATTRGDLTTFSVVTPYGPNHPDARALVADLRDPASALAPPGGMEVLVGGGAAEVVDVVDRIGDDFPRAALFILVTTYLVLFMLLRSVVLPAKALVMNSLSILASFGALVWIFQDGNLSALLGFQPLGFVETSQPVILFCVLFGLSMDYEVFLLSRMKEVYDRTGDNRQAVARGLERSGRIVTSAALIVVLVAGSFAFADVVLIKALGIGMAVAVALDATIVRALLVPATMRLLGDWNWWLPRRLARFVAARLPVVEGATLIQLLTLSLVALLLVGACAPSGAVFANAPSPPPEATPQPSAPSVAADPQPLAFPRDEGPHQRLMEWWYYTGHLRADDGRRFGFEFVIFRGERGAFPLAWASHLAVTDEDGERFLYEQRNEIGPQVDRSEGGQPGFDLAIVGGGPAAVTTGAEPTSGAADTAPWTMAGANGRDTIDAGGDQFGLDLSLDAGDRPPVKHFDVGWVDFGPAGSSYYYSRTRMEATGFLTLAGEHLAVEGIAWFDHQWGDFIAIGSGGWDWFAINLDDGSDLMVSMIRAEDGSYPLAYAELVASDGSYRHLGDAEIEMEVTDQWTSQITGATYPAGWTLSLPTEDLTIELQPTVNAQELDTRQTTGVVYWEGSQVVRATRAGRELGGEAYVELTGYGPGLETGR